MVERAQVLIGAELTSWRLVLLPVTLELADAILAGDFSGLSERGLKRTAGWPRGDTLEIMSFILIMKETAGPCWLVARRNDGVIIGDLGCKGQPGEDGEVEIGYGIVAGEQGKGYGTEVVQTVVHWLSEQPKVQTITAECLRGNEASIRVLEKVGMQRRKTEGNMLYWRLACG